MPLQFEQYRIRDGETALSELFLNRILRSIDARIATLEEVGDGIVAIQQRLQDRGTLLINEAVLPITQELEAQSEIVLNQATVSLETTQTIINQIQQYFDELEQNNTITGGLTLTGNITANNLSGTNTGDEVQATASTLGTVKTHTTQSPPVVYLKSEIDTQLTVTNSAIAAANNEIVNRLSKTTASRQTIESAVTASTQFTTTDATFTPDLSQTNYQKLTLTGNVSIANPLNYPVSGQSQIYNLVLIQDATGGRSLSWDTDYQFGAAGEPDIAAGPGDHTIVSFLADELKMWYLGSNAFEQ